MKTIQFEFVKFIPNEIVYGVLYITIEFKTAVHSCACGCGNRVITPLTPTDWSLIYNGKSVSLHPSIGNWNFECKSHYWIKKNEIIFAKGWTFKEINNGRKMDKKNKKNYFKSNRVD